MGGIIGWIAFSLTIMSNLMLLWQLLRSESFIPPANVNIQVQEQPSEGSARKYTLEIGAVCGYTLFDVDVQAASANTHILDCSHQLPVGALEHAQTMQVHVASSAPQATLIVSARRNTMSRKLQAYGYRVVIDAAAPTPSGAPLTQPTTHIAIWHWHHFTRTRAWLNRTLIAQLHGKPLTLGAWAPKQEPGMRAQLPVSALTPSL